MGTVQTLGSLAFPVLYLSGLFAIFYTFGRIQKQRKALFDSSSHYFDINAAKIEYEELSEQYSPDEVDGRNVLVVALMKWAIEAVRRVLRLREERPPLVQVL